MDVSTIAALGMRDDGKRMETISHNIANVLTPGFKRQVAVPASFTLELQAAQRAAQLPPQMHLDPSAGPLRPSATTQDAAIEGAGFFEVLTPEGPAFTRQGNFRVDLHGRLVGAHGMPVMGSGGEIMLTSQPFQIAPNGDVMQAGKIAGRLRVVHFDNPEALAPASAGLYHQAGARVDMQRRNVALRPGFLEGSNVSSPQEMVRLTETVRHFESLQKVVQGYDELLEKTIRKLGEF